MLKYKRILLKLSGEALMGEKQHGIDAERLQQYAIQIKEVMDLGLEVGIVIGGGNIFRGVSGAKEGFDRVQGDYMGMLATVINGLAIQGAIEKEGGRASLFTSIEMSPVGIRYSKRAVLKAFDNGEASIFVFGTGNPFFTTDTTAALKAVEIDAEVFLKGTRVDGVYTADPEKDPTATKYDTLSFDEAYNKGLKIMDLTAFTMCKENKLPVVVFDMNTVGNLSKLVQGEDIGTIIQ
ncbi:MAG: UMP kinase [Bacteroidales bacterium]|nr:UMP kinase [Bacteroidales bacterium]MBN2817815.1 UMP kinase [Bacteroidales bacterium]